MDLKIRYTSLADGTKKASIPDDTREWALSFIQEQAGEPSSAIEAVVQAGQDKLLGVISDMSDGQACFTAATGEWSALDLMAHVVTTKQVVVGLCRSLGQGMKPPGIGPEWEEESAQDGITTTSFSSILAARDAAQAAHLELRELIRDLDGANTDICFSHYIFGPLNAREWAVFQRIHDGDHIPQIERIVASPDFPS